MIHRIWVALLVGVGAVFTNFVLRYLWYFARARIEQDREELQRLRAENHALRQRLTREG